MITGKFGIMWGTNQNAGAVLRTPAGATPKELASMPHHPTPKHTCAQCGGWKQNPSATICRTCYLGNAVTSTVCTQCGGPRQRRAKPGLCLACYKQNGRGPAIHRDDDTTLLPLPQGRYATIDTEDYERVEGLSWHLTGNGYVAAKVPGKRATLLHRLITGAAPGEIVDHRNHDSLDNRKANLAVGTQSENMHNVKPRKGRRYRGVVLRKDTGRWSAQIRYAHRTYSLGCYDTEEEAAEAYNRAAVKLLGNRAVLNDVPEKGGN